MSLKKKKEKNDDFSIEKEATAIHAEHLIYSLKNKYIDPLILYRRQFPNYKIRQHRTISDDDVFSLSKYLVSQYIKTKNDGDKLNLDLKTNILPSITPIKIKNNISKKLMATSGMFKNKAYSKNNYQKLKLGNAMNCKKNDDSFYKHLYPKIENINKINDKYNLNLNLRHLDEEKRKNKNYNQRSINKKRDMVNYLIKKYIFAPSCKNNDTEKNNYTLNVNENVISPTINKRFKQNGLENGQKNSLTLDNINIKKNNNNHCTKDDSFDNVNTFITKIKIKSKSKNRDESKKNFEKTNINNKIKKPRKQIFKYLLDKNKDIIKHDQKIAVDCLYSKANSNLDEKKIFYNPLDNAKTNFSITKDPSYKKIKKFEKMIDNIIKIPNDLTITANK